jgi:acetolactate synthase regulatory subunit
MMKKLRASSASKSEEWNVEMIVDSYYIYETLIHRRPA